MLLVIPRRQYNYDNKNAGKRGVKVHIIPLDVVVEISFILTEARVRYLLIYETRFEFGKIEIFTSFIFVSLSSKSVYFLFNKSVTHLFAPNFNSVLQ
jgi:hypothetical protein